MTNQLDTMETMEREDKVRLALDFMHRMIVHYALWFTEVRHQMGSEKALDALDTASRKSFGIQGKRLCKVLGLETKDNIPAIIADLSSEKLDELLQAVAINWLANDGVWFQSVEFESGMIDAKRCNDSCWAHFSPVEARSIKKILGMGEHPGLEGLKKALAFRLYAFVNVQSIQDEGENSFVFYMNDCRVQSARKRKGLEDYPCKSAGLVEYPYFARAIDSRIRTECVGCPPDKHPDDWFCAWRFILEE